MFSHRSTLSVDVYMLISHLYLTQLFSLLDSSWSTRYQYPRYHSQMICCQFAIFNKNHHVLFSLTGPRCQLMFTFCLSQVCAVIVIIISHRSLVSVDIYMFDFLNYVTQLILTSLFTSRQIMIYNIKKRIGINNKSNAFSQY
jgi:hypothetical protein